MAIIKEKKEKLLKSFGGDNKNTGSIEGQIALLTERITDISNHLKKAPKDFATSRGLIKLVGKRKRLLIYLHNNKLESYRSLIQKLGLRK